MFSKNPHPLLQHGEDNDKRGELGGCGENLGSGRKRRCQIPGNFNWHFISGTQVVTGAVALPQFPGFVN